MGIRDRFSKFMSKSKRKKKNSSTASETPTIIPAPEVVTAVDPPPKVDDESPSLWDTAYDQLKTRDRGLIEEYEEALLSNRQSNDEAAALLRGLDD
ncbi:hypothetical protein PG996_004495 [Apiospora saccharicola]|uniref:Uncharacterized protein n=1 Tax=Apiospora saccharicola TaxID=335842 RepID=A0ABR1W4A2_9PEZI